MMIGSSDQLPVMNYLDLLWRDWGQAQLQESEQQQLALYQALLFDIRLPRILLTFLTGAALSASGMVLQGVFRNPLVDSYVLGISSGAACGAALSITLGGLPLNLSAFLGGGLAVLLTYLVATSVGKRSIISIVLGGMVISGFFTAGLMIIQYLSNPYKLQVIVQWMMGNLHAASWTEMNRAYAPILGSLLLVYILRWRINLLSLGDDAAAAVGVNPFWDKALLISAATIMTSATVASAGIISFYGLFLPHIVRMLMGADNRSGIPASMFLGGTLLLIIDDFSRVLFTFELPIGIFTMVIGGGFFIYLMRKNSLNWQG